MTGKQPVRVGVIGTGAISQVVHVPILSERTDVALVAVADADMHKAEAISRRFEVPLVMESDDVLQWDELDAVVVSTPNHLHEQMAVAALGAGKHVLVERPLATSSAGVRRVLDAAAAAGRCLTVGMAHRYRPTVSALRAFATGGELGRVYSVRGSWLTRLAPVPRPTWRQNRERAGGGALMDLGVPALDLCMWLVGHPQVRRVSASVTYGDHEVEDAATVWAETGDGLALSVEVSNRYFSGNDRYYARVMGTEGSGSLPPLQVYRQFGGRPLEVTPRQPTPRGGENAYTNAYRRQIDHFIRGVSGESQVKLPAEQEGLMALIEAAYRSASEGAEVEP